MMRGCGCGRGCEATWAPYRFRASSETGDTGHYRCHCRFVRDRSCAGARASSGPQGCPYQKKIHSASASAWMRSGSIGAVEHSTVVDAAAMYDCRVRGGLPEAPRTAGQVDQIAQSAVPAAESVLADSTRSRAHRRVVAVPI